MNFFMIYQFSKNQTCYNIKQTNPFQHLSLFSLSYIIILKKQEIYDLINFFQKNDIHYIDHLKLESEQINFEFFYLMFYFEHKIRIRKLTVSWACLKYLDKLNCYSEILSNLKSLQIKFSKENIQFSDRIISASLEIHNIKFLNLRELHLQNTDFNLFNSILSNLIHLKKTNFKRCHMF